MRKASNTCLNVNRVRFTFDGHLFNLEVRGKRVELSQKLKELRKKQGLTQLELAERLFVSRQAISGWEAGTSRPSTENLQSLSRLFNIPLETLLDDSAEAEPAAAQEKLPAEEQAKEEDKGQGKARRYKAIVLVIVLLAILLTTAVWM